MEHILIPGKRKSSSLLFLPAEKNLFYKTNNRNGQTEYCCYERVLSENENNDGRSRNKCSARLKVRDEVCTRNDVNHVKHGNHEHLFKDLVPTNNIKKMCAKLGSSLPTTKEIFYQELSNCEHKTNLVYDRMKRQLLRIKNSHYPCIPKTIEEIRNAFENTDLRAEFGLNSHKSHPLYFGTVVKTNFSFITFASVKYIERFDAEKSAKRQFEKNLHVSNKVHPYMIECKNRQRNKYVIGDNDYSMTFVSDVKKKLKGVNKMIKNTKIDRKRVVSLDSDDCEDSDQPKTKRLKKYQDNNNVCPLTIEEVKRKIRQGKLRTCKPKKDSRSYHLYKVCRKVKTRKGKILPEFFICTICGNVMKVNVSTHHNTLKRHYNRCTGNTKHLTITTTSGHFRSFLESIMQLGAEFGGPINLADVTIPKILDHNTRNVFISAMKNAHGDSYHRLKK